MSVKVDDDEAFEAEWVEKRLGIEQLKQRIDALSPEEKREFAGRLINILRKVPDGEEEAAMTKGSRPTLMSTLTNIANRPMPEECTPPLMWQVGGRDLAKMLVSQVAGGAFCDYPAKVPLELFTGRTPADAAPYEKQMTARMAVSIHSSAAAFDCTELIDGVLDGNHEQVAAAFKRISEVYRGNK